MKRKLLVMALMLSATGFAQNFGINLTGAAGDPSAALDVDIANKGVLVPRIPLTATNVAAPVIAPATSLLVYNTATAGTFPTNVTPGYYYWDGVKWVRLLGGSLNTYWIVGTSAATVNTPGATGFIGTSDNNHVDFVTNGTVRGRLSNLGEFFIGTTATSLPGDLMNGVSNAAFPWAINGYSAQNGSGVYGQRQAGATGTWGAIQGETDPALAANNNGTSGLAGANTHRGVNGQKPTGGLGWGGLFLNDLGYTGFFGVASDERLKINIKPLKNGIDLIRAMQIYSYNMDTVRYTALGSGNVHYGVMAQELKQILPDLVVTKNVTPGIRRSGEQLVGPEMDIQMVNYIELIPIAIEAIKEQQQIIDSQNEELEELKKRILLLEQKLLPTK